MIDVLLLRLDAPLMSFGGVMVDNHGVTNAFPTRSMLAGLCANALGWDHRDAARTTALQRRLRYAARADRDGEPLRDFQTVDLGAPYLSAGWTTRGAPEGRGGGEARERTHIRYRHYLADAVYTVALMLGDDDDPAVPGPSLDVLAAALREPERPLFIGRKSCLPSTPMILGTVKATTLLGALEAAPRAAGTPAGKTRLRAWWPGDEDTQRPDARLIAVTDERDWVNQIHAGRRFVHEGTIALPPPGGPA